MDLTMLPLADFRVVHSRSPQLGRCEVVRPVPRDDGMDVYLPDTVLTGAQRARDDGSRGARHALWLPDDRQSQGPHWRVTPRGHTEAGVRAGRHQLDAEITMVENCTLLPLDVEMTGSMPCSDVEHFSGYIITTGRTR